MKDYPVLLEAMLSDQHDAGRLYRPGPYWQAYQRRVATAVSEFGIERFRAVTRIGKGFADTMSYDPLETAVSFRGKVAQRLSRLPIFRHLVAPYKKMLRHNIALSKRYRSLAYNSCHGELLAELEDESAFPNTLHGGTEDVIQINGRTYSSPYVTAALRFASFKRMGTDFSQMRSLIEIGGGFGAATHLLVSRHPNLRKVLYIDIPPMIYIGTQYLRHFFGDDVQDYLQTRNRKSIRFSNDDTIEIICLCPWQIERIDDQNIDFLLNTASFSEMTPDIVENYARHCERILSPQALIALVLNKMQPANGGNAEICTPDRVLASFDENLTWARLPGDQFCDLGNLYALGSRSGS